MNDDTTTDARQDVQTLLDAIEDAGWTVTEYDADRLDRHEPTRLDVELEQRERVEMADLPDLLTAGEDTARPGHTVRSVIQAEQDDYDDGVPVSVVVAAVTDEETSEADVLDAIETAQLKGEVYEPVEGHLRST